jgi:hypothetical protein
MRMMMGNNRNGRKAWLKNTANKTNGMENRSIFFFMESLFIE